MNQTLSDQELRKIAEKKVQFRYSVKIHFIIFILVNSLLLLINLLTSQFFWVVFPFFGWLIGVVIHCLSYILYARGVYPRGKRALLYTITAYSFSMLFLFVTNYITLGVINWALYPTFFAGIGVLIYIFIYLLFFSAKLSNDGEKKSKIERAVDKEMEKLAKKRNKL
ncbi:MAG: 2TM domain-containing protein [Promethearchaeota archaeon]